jgi:SulP family sulfate permease
MALSEPPPSSAFAAAIYRWIPAIGVLRGYDAAAARHDLVAGLSVAAVAVPQAMAYALIVGLPPEIGLYTAIVMTAAGALFASSRQLINGPTNAISIAMLSAVGAIAVKEELVATVVLMSFLVGAVQLAISLFRLGDLTRYISHSVIVGFTAGASVLLVLDQTKNLLGLSAQGSPHDHFLERFWRTMTEGGAVHVPTLVVGLASIAAVLALGWLKKKLDWPLFPELLVVVAGAAAMTAALGLDGDGVAVIGAIPAALPAISIPNLDIDEVQRLSSGALAIGLLGLLEAIAMSKALAAKSRQKLDLNQQCLSEGVANLAGSFFHCMPGSGSLTRSAINQQAGGRTQWSGVVSAVAVAVTMLVFAPYAHYVPRAALAGILVVTAWRMVSFRELRYHVRVSRFDAVLVIVTAVSAVTVSIEFCVLVGVVFSFFLAVPRMGNVLLTEFVAGSDGLAHERLPSDRVCGHVLIYGLEGEMFFGSVASLESRFDTILGRIDPETQIVILRAKRVRHPDASGMALFAAFLEQLEARGVHVILCGVRDGFHDVLVRSGLAEKLGEARIFREQPVRQTSTMLAIEHATRMLKPGCPHCPKPRTPDVA